MKTSPLVSVIIPTYNAEAWIREAVNSALAQTYSPIEVIVVDDFSKDRTCEILSSFGNRVRVIKNHENRGVSASRNIGIEASQGEFIALLDHDDIWQPQKLEKQMALFSANPNLGLVFCDATYQIDNSNQWRSFELDPPSKGHVFQRLLEHNFILCLTAVIPRHVLAEIGQFDPRFSCSEDYDLFLRIAEKFPVDYIDETLATYRVHDKNFTRNVDFYYAEWIQVLEKHLSQKGIKGVIALAHLLWAKESWRSEGRVWKSLTHLPKGGLTALADPMGFFRALRNAWHQKQKVRSNKK